MFETIASIVAIISAIFAFFKWMLPHIKVIFSKYVKNKKQINVSLKDKRVLEDLDKLSKKLIEQKINIFNGKGLVLSFNDPALGEIKSKIRKLKTEDQSAVLSYITELKDRLYLLNEMLGCLFKKETLKIIESLNVKDSDLCLVVDGMLKLFDPSLSGTKFDVWQTSRPQVSFSIKVTSEEVKAIEKKIKTPISLLIGPGALSAYELPGKVIACKVIPEIIHQISINKNLKGLSGEELERAFALFDYHVGLG